MDSLWEGSGVCKIASVGESSENLVRPEAVLKTKAGWTAQSTGSASFAGLGRLCKQHVVSATLTNPTKVERAPHHGPANPPKLAYMKKNIVLHLCPRTEPLVIVGTCPKSR